MDINSIYNVDIDVNYKNCSIEKNGFEPDTKYRELVLNCFNLSIEQFERLTERIDLVYNYIELNKELFNKKQYDLFNDVLTSLASTLMSEDKKFGLLVLFSYDFFDKTHLFLRELINNKQINCDILEDIKKNI